MRDVGILAGVPARAALAQQIPVLIELHFDGLEALAVLGRERSTIAVLEQTVLFFDEVFDMDANLLIVHLSGVPSASRCLRGPGRHVLPAARLRLAETTESRAAGRLSSPPRHRA